MGYDPFQGDRPAQELWPTSRERLEAPPMVPGLPGQDPPEPDPAYPLSEAGYRELAQVAPPGSIRRATVGVATAIAVSIVLMAGLAFLLVDVGLR